MIRLFISLLVLFVMSVSTLAQKEIDFASTYMDLHAKGGGLACTTVSPAMITRMMQLEKIERNQDNNALPLEVLRSARVVTSTGDEHEAAIFYDKATSLLKHNKNRYKLYDEYEGKSLYVRKRGHVIVELILLTKNEGKLHMVDLTGNMDEKCVNLLTQL